MSPLPETRVSLAQLRLIVGCLLAGIVTFAAVAAVVGPRIAGDAPNEGLALALVGTAGALALANLVVQHKVSQGTYAKLAARKEAALDELARDRVPVELVSLTILRGALGESIGMLGCVALLVSASPLAYAPIAVGVLWTASALPAVERFREGIDAASRGRL